METKLQKINDHECLRLQRSVELIGKRWSSGIMLAITRDAVRFTEILTSVDGLSDRLLSQRLKELETVGLIRREVIATTPVQVRYYLTEKGDDLMSAMEPMAQWAQRWAPAGS